MKIKKVLAMCLISAMVLGSFAGCGKDEGESTVLSLIHICFRRQAGSSGQRMMSESWRFWTTGS